MLHSVICSYDIRNSAFDIRQTVYFSPVEAKVRCQATLYHTSHVPQRHMAMLLRRQWERKVIQLISTLHPLPRLRCGSLRAAHPGNAPPLVSLALPHRSFFTPPSPLCFPGTPFINKLEQGRSALRSNALYPPQFHLMSDFILFLSD